MVYQISLNLTRLASLDYHIYTDQYLVKVYCLTTEHHEQIKSRFRLLTSTVVLRLFASGKQLELAENDTIGGAKEGDCRVTGSSEKEPTSAI